MGSGDEPWSSFLRALLLPHFISSTPPPWVGNLWLHFTDGAVKCKLNVGQLAYNLLCPLSGRAENDICAAWPQCPGSYLLFSLFLLQGMCSGWFNKWRVMLILTLLMNVHSCTETFYSPILLSFTLALKICAFDCYIQIPFLKEDINFHLTFLALVIVL